VPMLNTVAPCWRVKLLKKLSLLSALALTGCSSSYAVAPRLPMPAADLMTPEPTGSEYLQAVSRNMSDWAETLQGLPTK